MSSNDSIHVGSWNNLSKQGASGITLTLSNRHGVILIAVLAIFIQFVGAHSWSIICFFTHQLRTSLLEKDGLHHQQQATLRNNNSDLRTLWELTNLWWSWRSISPRTFQKCLPLILICTFHLLMFATAGILSAHITTVDNQVLFTEGQFCGPWEVQVQSPDGEDASAVLNEAYVASRSYLVHSLLASRQYAQSCIKEEASLPDCARFKRRQLPWTLKNVPCPFQDLCLGPPNSSLFLDTGLLDSRDDFGINGQDADRIKIRRSTTCSPITTEGYTKNGTTSINYQVFNHPTSFGSTLSNYTAAFYGPSAINNTSIGVSDPALENMTFMYTNFREAATVYYNYYSSPYDIMSAQADPLGGSFEPIPALSVQNSTLALIFASFYGLYTGPNDDLWLSAHQSATAHQTNGNTGNTVTNLVGPDRTLSVLACVEQFQFCNVFSDTKDLATCTPPASSLQMDDYNSSKAIFQSVLQNERQVATALAFSQQFAMSNILSMLSSGSSTLLAQSLCTGQMCMPPAANQWILEVENWFQIGMVLLQRLTLEYISGPPPQYTKYIAQNESNKDAGLKWLCKSQTVRRNDFTNFSTVSISLVFGLGTLIILASLCLESAVGYMRLKYRKGYWKQNAWWSEGTWQLQRRAFEGIGIRDWELGRYDCVPLTGRGRAWSAGQNWDELLPPGEEEQKAKMSERGTSRVLNR